MARQIRFEVPGKPVGWQRVGTNKYTGAKYTQAQTRNAEARIAWAAKTAAHGIFFEKGVPLSLVVYAYMPIPKSASKTDRELMIVGKKRPTVKPDWDNIGKLMDALNGVIWHDDAQVVYGSVSKRYAYSEPKIVVVVSELVFEEDCDETT